jgi:hypothetical protein
LRRRAIAATPKVSLITVLKFPARNIPLSSKLSDFQRYARALEPGDSPARFPDIREFVAETSLRLTAIHRGPIDCGLRRRYDFFLRTPAGISTPDWKAVLQLKNPVAASEQ